MSTKEKVSEKEVTLNDSSHENEIILYNDDINTFEHVIKTLIDVCDHTPQQAEQCSLIVVKTKCGKSGSTDLRPV